MTNDEPDGGPDGSDRLGNGRRRRETGEAIRGGYEAMPQDDGEVGWPDQGTAAMVGEEPW